MSRVVASRKKRRDQIDHAIAAVRDTLNEECAPKQMPSEDYVEVLQTLMEDFAEQIAERRVG